MARTYNVRKGLQSVLRARVVAILSSLPGAANICRPHPPTPRIVCNNSHTARSSTLKSENLL